MQKSNDDSLLAWINEALKEVGADARQKRLPASARRVVGLAEVNLLVVDDIREVLQCCAAELTMATDRKIGLMHHTSESADELVTKIRATKSDLVLLDQNLSGGVKGADITKMLMQGGFSGVIVGFSATDDKAAIEQKFIKAGALGWVDKSDATARVAQIAALYKDEVIRRVAKRVGRFFEIDAM